MNRHENNCFSLIAETGWVFSNLPNLKTRRWCKFTNRNFSAENLLTFAGENV